MMSPIEIIEHTKSKALAINDADPDNGNDWKCNACLLPIFSTPLVDDPNVHTQGRTQPLRSAPGHMHDQCANKIPAKLEDHPLHPMAGLILQHVQPDDDDDNNKHEYYCSRCESKCGSKFYKCRCGFTLDLLCASPITIVHQSHGHELTATRGGSSSCSFICCACGTQHDRPKRGEWGVSYVCSPCDFWIHPDCAVLPNAIIVVDDDKAVVHHDHPLLLSYEKYRAKEWNASRFNVCAICGGDNSECWGWYRCFHCDYSVHIKCVVYSDPPHKFNKVLLRDAKVPGLIHLPKENEHQSVVQRIMNSTTIDCAISTSSSSYNSKVHQHPLVINQLLRNNNNNDDDDDGDDRVCNACVQLISPLDEFYSCSKVNNNNSCRDFFVHSCCAQLPDEITTPRCSLDLNEYHTLSLLVEAEAVGNKFPFLRSVMGGKYYYDRHLHNGFAYFCKVCDKYIDVINALMPASITHDAHAKSHILCITYGWRTDLICSCCKRNPGYSIQIGYECNNCNNFFIHMDCALLPNKVSHDFDRHPLNLITTNHHQEEEEEEEEEEEVSFCEICEENMDDTGRWFYGCKKCDNSFHVACMPYFDYLSKIKFGFTIRVKGHSCPLACVRALSVQGYKCAHCHHVIRESDEIVFKWREYYSRYKIAFECAECDYMIHEGCAKELLLKA